MAQGFAFGRPAPLPSPVELLIGEVTDAPAEEVVATVGRQTDDRAAIPAAQGEQDEDDDPADHRQPDADVLPLRGPRRAEPAEELVETATGDPAEEPTED